MHIATAWAATIQNATTGDTPMHMPSQERLGVGHGWISHLGTRASHGRAGAKLYGHDMARCRKKMTHRNSKRRVGQASSRGEQDRERREGEDSVRVEGGGRSNLNPSRSEVGGRARGLGGTSSGGGGVHATDPHAASPYSRRDPLVAEFECARPAATIRPTGPSGLKRCSWPTTSAKLLGRSRSASGRGASCSRPPDSKRSLMGGI